MTTKLIVQEGDAIFGEAMKSLLIVDRTDSKCLLLEQIICATSSHRAKQEMAKQGIKTVNNAGSMIRILIFAMFFSVEIQVCHLAPEGDSCPKNLLKSLN